MKNERYQIPQGKVKQVEQLLNQTGLDALLLFDREGMDGNVNFLLGVETIHLGAIFLHKSGKHVVLTSEGEQGKYAETGIFTEVIPYETRINELLVETIDRMGLKTIALNISEHDQLCDGLTVGLYQMLEGILGKERLGSMERSSEAILKEVRSVKTEVEVERIRKAVLATNDIYDEVFQSVRCGMSEKEISDLMISGMKARGLTSGIGAPYDPPIVCLVRAGLAHRKPGDTKSIPGDICIMDFSVRYQGYVSDIARTAYFLKPDETEPPEEVQKAFDTAIHAISETIAFIGAGKKGHEVDAVGRKAIEDGGYPTVRHSVGHQIGRECHDGGTRLGPIKNPVKPDVYGVIRVGETYAIEPTVIQDDGLPCMLVEENVVIREDHAEILSRRQTSLYLIPSE